MVVVKRAITSVTDTDGTIPDSIHLETPTERAYFLWSLKSHAASFSPEEHQAYNVLRDDLVRFARDGGSLDALYARAAMFAKYLEMPHVVLPLQSSPGVVTQEPQKVEVVEVMAQKGVVSPKLVSGGRRGPDIAKPTVAEVVMPPVVVAEPAAVTAEAKEAVTEEVSQEKIAEVGSGNIVSKVSIASEVTVDPIVVPSAPEETKKNEAVQASSEARHVAEMVVAPEGVPQAQVNPEIGTDLNALREEVRHINESLNTFANGKAFQWLSESATGYREYMNALIALRGDLNVTDASHETIDLLKSQVKELKGMAENVESIVGGGQPPQVHIEAPVPEKVFMVPNAKEVDALRTQENMTVASVVESDPGTVKVPVETENLVPEAMPGELVHEEVIDQPEVPATESISPAQSFIQSQETVEHVYVPGEPSEPLLPPLREKEPRVFENTAADVFAGSVVAEPSLEENPAEEAPFVSPQEAPIAPVMAESPQTATPESLNTPEINAGLHTLLTKWLGTTGFLGFGASGEEHPDWLAIKELFVEDAQADDGTIPKGLRPETMANLRANLKAWSDKYGLFIESPSESVEHFLRRVVRASTTP